jgi:hypothetical protein
VNPKQATRTASLITELSAEFMSVTGSAHYVQEAIYTQTYVYIQLTAKINRHENLSFLGCYAVFIGKLLNHSELLF